MLPNHNENPGPDEIDRPFESHNGHVVVDCPSTPGNNLPGWYFWHVGVYGVVRKFGPYGDEEEALSHLQTQR
jgi:hypothetical protein